MPLALSTGHEVGLAVTAGAFIAFALSSSFLFPRVRRDYPGGGLRAFVVVSFVFFFGMLAAVEHFGAEGGGERVAETTPAQATTTATTSTQPGIPPAAPGAAATTVQVTETEFKIALGSTSLKAGAVTFDVKNGGKIPHDLAIKGMSQKTKLIQAGGSATLTVTLKPGKYELYCSVPGHEAAGMKVKITVTSSATTTTPATTTAPSAAATTVQVTETEFKIVADSTTLKAGAVTFDVKNGGKIPHDLAIKGMSQKTKLIQAGGSATLTVTLKRGKYELYCSVPGHEAAGMKVNITVTSSATTTTPATTTAPGAAATTVQVSETEFKIAADSTSLKAGAVTFDVKNGGKIPHDLAIKGMSQKTKLIQAGGSATLTVTLKPGKYELYCSVPGHEAAGMKLNITVS